MRIPELSCNRIIYMTFIKQQYNIDYREIKKNTKKMKKENKKGITVGRET